MITAVVLLIDKIEYELAARVVEEYLVESVRLTGKLTTLSNGSSHKF